MKINYQQKLDEILARLDPEAPPSLLLHSCCAPCSSYVLEYLARYFDITVFYCNPNIEPAAEYEKRREEQKRLLSLLPAARPVRFAEGPYAPEEFREIARGLEAAPEGGERCFRCYELRLRRAAEYARSNGFDFFTTTLSVSPYKNAEKLNEIGRRLAGEYGVPWLCSDFKKKGGYQRSIQLSREYGLYRQNYCGCLFSRQAREAPSSEAET